MFFKTFSHFSHWKIKFDIENMIIPKTTKWYTASMVCCEFAKNRAPPSPDNPHQSHIHFFPDLQFWVAGFMCTMHDPPCLMATGKIHVVVLSCWLQKTPQFLILFPSHTFSLLLIFQGIYLSHTRAWAALARFPGTVRGVLLNSILTMTCWFLG